MNQFVFILTLLLSVFLLNACGQTGDLYLPTDDQDQTSQEQESSEDKE